MKEVIGEMKTHMREMFSRMNNLGTDIEAIKDYLRDLKEATLDKQNNDKGNASIELEPFPSYSLSMRE